ncbi:MAG TPA: chromosomal replication initiator protein DnaA [Ignavibacteria bacterium]|nr:chromosomal replication initiator protein DnaA [Ignavibacteria bacterium]HMR39823.1 chromosomal replication initiator protein DnaA [Ignavibacteria bacterium]
MINNLSASFDDSSDLNKKNSGESEGNSESRMNAVSAWNKFIELLSDNLKTNEVNTWFSVIAPKQLENNVLTVTVPSEDYYSLIESRYNKIISKIIETLLGPDGKLNYEISQMGLFSNNDIADQKELPVHNTVKNSSLINVSQDNKYIENIKLTESDPEDEFNSNLNQKHIFDNFIKGESNELAVAAAYAITNNPGKIYNPFFVYGGVGLGKTHLVQAIGNEIQKKFPEKKIYYTTAPDFTTQFTTNIAQSRIDFSSNRNGTKKLDSFYKSLDVLILDDIQYLSGKEKTQDFMYQIFNTLYNEKKHIIFSSDKPISQIKGIEERLISRFQWGITVDMQPPNWEMRVAIIQKKFEETNIDAPEEVIHFIATNVKDSIRTIEGCIVGIIADSVLRYGGEVNLEIAENVIGRVVGNIRKAKNISIENIIFTVAEYYDISENQILSRKRTKEIAFARQVAMYLAKELTSLTLETIGLNFGGKDHATVLYSFNSVSALVKKDKKISDQILEIKELIKNL